MIVEEPTEVHRKRFQVYFIDRTASTLYRLHLNDTLITLCFEDTCFFI